MTADVTARFHGGNAESQLAFESLHDRTKLTARVVDCIRMRGGATSDEVESLLGLPHQTVSARITEAKRDGLLVPSGEKRKTRSGRRAAVLVYQGPKPCKGCGDDTNHRSGYCSSWCYEGDNE